MLSVINAQEVLRKTIDVVVRVKADHLSGNDYEQERDRLFQVKDQILDLARQHPEAKNFNGLKILEKATFIYQVVGKVDKMLAACMFIQLSGDITGVYLQ